MFGEDGDGELAQLCARDAAQTALRLMGESTTPPVGDTPATPKSPGAFLARSLALTRTGRVGQDTSGEVEVEAVVDCHRAQARMVAPIVAPAPARAAEEADALPSNTIKLSPYHPNPTPDPERSPNPNQEEQWRPQRVASRRVSVVHVGSHDAAGLWGALEVSELEP